MSKIVCLGILFLTILSCKTASAPISKLSVAKTPEANNTDKNSIPEKVYFKSSGTEPFWALTISEDKIIFNTISDSIVADHVAPILAMDANVKLYQLKTEMEQINIQISQQNCVNEMSGITSPYSVNIEYKKSNSSEFEKINGCGQYITDYRLHDIWVLEELNGKKITKEDFSKEFPIIEIYASQKSFEGFAGCNRMNGTLIFEKDKLQFTNVAITKMICEPVNKEAEFLTALQSVNTYKIENNKLILSNPSSIKIKLKKID